MKADERRTEIQIGRPRTDANQNENLAFIRENSRLGVFTLAQSLDDESEIDKSHQDNVEFLEARKNAAKSLQPAKQALRFIAFPVESAIIGPRLASVGFRWNHRNHVQLQHQLPGCITFVGSIHHQRNFHRQRTEFQ